MNRPLQYNELATIGIPHACGDEPVCVGNKPHIIRYSPRMWG